MIPEKENTRISKFLSLVLRHKPEAIGIVLDERGWTDVEVLIRQLDQNDFHVNFDILKHVVETNSKSRFSFNDDQTKIRARQGHSISVELGYKSKEPPELLYHGTAERFLDSILKAGLQKQARHHVHLSADKQTAIAVGQRYGKPVVLQIQSAKMFEKGYCFYMTENNVWLTEYVPVEHITISP